MLSSITPIMTFNSICIFPYQYDVRQHGIFIKSLLSISLYQKKCEKKKRHKHRINLCYYYYYLNLFKEYPPILYTFINPKNKQMLNTSGNGHHIQ